MITGTPPTEAADLTNIKRILTDEFAAVMQRGDGLLKYISQNTRSALSSGGKAEWLEKVISQESDTLNNSAAVLAADTSFVVSNIDRFRVGMEITWHGYLESMTVTAVDSGTSTVHVSREANGITAPTSVADKTTIDIINLPTRENEKAIEGGADEPTVEYNLFEGFRVDIPFTMEATEYLLYGYNTFEDYKMAVYNEHLDMLRERLNKSILFNERRLRTTSTRGRMRGLYTWLMQTGTNKEDLSGAAVTASKVNDMLYSIYQDDTMVGNLALYMDAVQARKFAGFNTTLANQIVQKPYGDPITGGVTYITSFRGDLAAVGDVRIIVDKYAKAGTVAAINLAKLGLEYSPKGEPKSWDSKSNEQDPDSSREAIFMSATLRMKDHKYSHGLIYGGLAT